MISPRRELVLRLIEEYVVMSDDGGREGVLNTFMTSEYSVEELIRIILECRAAARGEKGPNHAT